MRYVLILPLLLCFSGCDKLDIKVKEDATQVAVYTASEQSKEIAASMTNVSKSDCELMYKQFGGLSLYFTHSGKNIPTTAKMVDIIGRFQEDYGWTREKYTEYTDAVELFLVKQGYKQAKNIVTSVSNPDAEVSRTKVATDMNTIADAAKIAMESK